MKIHQLVLITAALIPACAKASLEGTTTCNEDFCWAVTKHQSDEMKDYYFYGQLEILRQLVVRFRSGSMITVRVEVVPPKNCKKSRLNLSAISEKLAKGQGCLTTKDGKKSVKITYIIATKGVGVTQFLHRVDPVIWLSSFDEKGNYIPAGSPIITLDGK